MSGPERCERCDKPRATEADHDAIPEGEGEHLCWSSYGTECDAIDWRARALAAEAALDAERAERAAMESWDGLMRLLDRVAPEDIFPTAEDSLKRDPGPRLASALRLLDAERKAHEETRRELRQLEREYRCAECSHNVARAEAAEGDRDEAFRHRDEMVDGWKARAEKAERERDEAQRVCRELHEDLHRTNLQLADEDTRADKAEAAFAACAEAAGVVYEDGAPYDVATVCEVIRAACAKECPHCVGLAEERDEAQAALVGLREAVEARGQCWEHADACCREWCRACQAEVDGDARLTAAIAAIPSTLAGQVRARVLREAADTAIERDVMIDGYCFGQSVAAWLRALADEAEKTR